MKTIGLIGGMSWESTLVYYKLINQHVRAQRGGLHSAPILLHSFDFTKIVELQRAGDWDGAAGVLSDAACGLRAGGAEAVAICTNTMHKVALEVSDAVAPLPLIHIGDATGTALRKAGITRVGLLGTRYTMEQPFFRDHLKEQHGIEVLAPVEMDRIRTHEIIFDELCQGVVCPDSRGHLLQIIDRLAARGAEGVILGCTELMLLLPHDQEHGTPVPLFDTTALHTQAIAEWALS